MSEEGVGPWLMIGMALPEAGASGLLSQERSQASSNEPVQFDEQAWSGMLEVSEPASDHWIEVFDDTAEAVAPASAGLGPDLVLERLQALAPHEPPAVFEPVSQGSRSPGRLAGSPRHAFCRGAASGRFRRPRFSPSRAPPVPPPHPGRE